MIHRSELLTVVATAKILKKTRMGINWLISKKRLKAIVDHVTPKGRKVYLIPRSELDRYKALDTCKVNRYPKHGHQRGGHKRKPTSKGSKANA